MHQRERVLGICQVVIVVEGMQCMADMVSRKNSAYLVLYYSSSVILQVPLHLAIVAVDFVLSHLQVRDLVVGQKQHRQLR